MCVTEVNQLEDPRLQWRQEQERMLKEYLVTAQEDLQVRTHSMIIGRASLAQLFKIKLD